MSDSERPEADAAAVTLGTFAAKLRFEDLAEAVVARAKSCILDTVGVCIGGAGQASSAIGSTYLKSTGAVGRSVVLDGSGDAVNVATAALLNGILSHAIEYDCLRKPGSGVHGAPVVVAALAAAQQAGLSGRDLITATVAGIEVMFRIGRATHHSCESRGFHAPGLTGPFGAAVAVGHLAGLGPERMSRCIGIAGSLSSGLLEFARAGDGSMVKKLHLGRGAESGVLAAGLAEGGFTGPLSVLDGAFGFLSVFCDRHEAGLLTRGLGTEFETLKLCFKRYPCHITAHAPIEAVLHLKDRHGIVAGDVAEIVVTGSAKMASLHNIPVPSDTGLARYSVPFCVAVAMAADPSDPRSFSSEMVSDRNLLNLAGRVLVRPFEPADSRHAWAVTVTIRTANGSTFSADVEDFAGTPTKPFDADQRRAKFLSLTGNGLKGCAEATFDRLEALEDEADVGWIGRPAAA